MKLFERKENPTGAAIYFENRFKTKNKNNALYIKEGYEENIIVYRCIREITTALASVEIEVHKGDDVIDNHPALLLLKKPNPTEGWSQFIRHAFTDYLITGNMFLTKYPDAKKPVELWAQSPVHMEVMPGTKGLPEKFVYSSGMKKIIFPVDQISGTSQVFHLKTYNPTNPFLGLSPMTHVALAADTHNNGLKWNSSLLENGARPSGIVKFKGNPSKDVLGKVREFFKETLQGSKNAGEVPILTDDADWLSMSESARDMDFLNAMKEMAKYVASAYGVPLPLIDNDASSFNNIEQAKERFWTDTALPLLDEFLEAFGNWLLPAYGEGLNFSYNQDSILSLEGVRERRFNRYGDAIGKGLMTINQAKEALDYEPVEGGDVTFIQSGLLPLDFMDMNDTPADKPEDAPDDVPDDEEESAAKFLKSLGYSEKEIKDIVSE